MAKAKNFREIRKPERNGHFLEGITITFRESVKPFGNSQNPKGNHRTFREFIKPDGNSQFPTGNCAKLFLMVDLQLKYGPVLKIAFKNS